MVIEETTVLEDVGMHEQRLAAAGCHPEGDFVELLPGAGGFVERCDRAVSRFDAIIPGG